MTDSCNGCTVFGVLIYAFRSGFISLFIFFFFLMFIDEPSCKTDQQHVYGAHKGEIAWVKCDVNSNPTPMSFRWAFNNSVSGLINVATSDRTADVVKFRVTDFGTLLCWATNSLTTQARPCVYHIVPAGKSFSSKVRVL
jgi:hypothetical protein